MLNAYNTVAETLRTVRRVDHDATTVRMARPVAKPAPIDTAALLAEVLRTNPNRKP